MRKPAKARPQPPRFRTAKAATIVGAPPPPPPSPVRFIFRAEVLERVNVSYVTLWNWMRDGKFPLAREIGPGKIAWLGHEVDNWILSRPPRQFKSRAEEAA